jgi:hypothetical protein
MPTISNIKLVFGPNKYAALHLIVARWVRQYANNGPHCYVTLGGTELRDVSSMRFVDSELVQNVWSYEYDKERYQFAQQSASVLQSQGIPIQVKHGSIWNHTRSSDLPHLFYIDLLGICAWSDYDVQLAAMFQNEVIREGDGLLITSHLGHNRGLPAIRKHFGGEFDVLGLDSSNDDVVKNTFRRTHPSLTLYKALSLNGIQSELSVRCFGAVKYKDKSPMGIYGYSISAGTTNLSGLVNDQATLFFDVKQGNTCESALF